MTQAAAAPVVDRSTPGALLLHPVSLLAIAILLINDHVLKAMWGNTLTGKLSDGAGILIVPLLLLCIMRLPPSRLLSDLAHRPGTTIAALSFSAAGLGAVKTVGPVGDAYAWTIGGLRWSSLLGTVDFSPILVVRDPTDVLVMPLLIVSFLIVRQVDRQAAASRPSGVTRP